MLEIVSNGSKWCGQAASSITELVEVLKNYTLDPTFESYGNFINHHPSWIKEEDKLKYKGCVVIFGNFMDISHVFNIITDNSKVISLITKAIEDNVRSEAYRRYKAELIKQKDKKRQAQEKYFRGEITMKEMYAML